MTWTLHLGDCLDPVTGLASLADKSVDHVITDPPYSKDMYLRYRTNAGAGVGVYATPGRKSGHVKNALEMHNLRIGAIDDLLTPMTAQIKRVCSRWAIVFSDVEISHRWREEFDSWYVRSGAWAKPDPMPQISGDRPGHGFEIATIAHPETRKRWNGGGRPALWICGTAKGDDRPDHPCPKPLELMEKLVRDFTDPGETILDPFAGSGTTGVAAIRLGRNFIGWEKDPKYHAIALKRLRAAREQLELCA